jgi:acetyl-CoA carboxylase biotin carboxylase subunit
MIKKILIANRGEIAVRIIRTCREMGIRTLAVYSDADRTALHVRMADEAVGLGGVAPAESYLNGEKIIAAAHQAKAQAIHPGYGFLSENAGFAAAVTAAGLIFIGPPPKAIELLGDKTKARALLKKAQLEVIPGMTSAGTDLAEIEQAAREIGYPVLLKAAYGGGGKGMRVVEEPQFLAAALKEAGSEAQRAFGDGAIYVEKYLIRPRHIEIQVIADQYGQAVHLGERECSLQRRHQKIIEESPSAAVTAELREAMGQAALGVIAATDYVNAGTVEFLLDSTGRFYFLEVNTRLQVEHPVTEMVTGFDLVRLQIEIAAGLPLSLKQKEVKFRGHALEARIYAEDPAQGFLPSPGKIRYLREPSGAGVRVDSGVYEGFEVPPHYDPILAKLIVHAPDRKQAASRLVRALVEYRIAGIKTPVAFLKEVVCHEAFLKGETHTGFLDQYFPHWQPRRNPWLAALAKTAIPAGESPDLKEEARLPRFLSPWDTLGKWSL